MNTTLADWETASTPMNISNQTINTSVTNTDTRVLDGVFILIALVGMTGNASVLCLLACHTQRKPFFVYILNLAGADFLFLCSKIIDSLGRIIHLPPSVSYHVDNLSVTMSNFAYIASTSMLSVISTERCMAVLLPIWYRNHPKHTSVITCALVWCLSLMLSLLEWAHCGLSWERYWCKVMDFIISIWLICLVLLLSVSSLVLISRLLCFGSQWKPLTRLYMSIGFSVLVFFLCGVPYGILWFLFFWKEGYFNVFSNSLHLAAYVLSCANSCANPFIYFFIGSFRQQQQRRKTLKLILQRAFEENLEIGQSEDSLPQEPLEMSGSSQVSRFSTTTSVTQL